MSAGAAHEGMDEGGSPPPAKRPFLSLVIPAHNEEKRLPSALERALAFASRQPYEVEIVIVENGSKDRTWDLASEAAVRHPQVRALQLAEAGKGGAVRLGMLEASGEYRFFCDADFSMPLEQVDAFLPPALEDVDVAIGSREASGSQRFDEPDHRHLMGRVYNRCVQLSLLPGIEDTQCGFKCFTARASQEVFSRQSLTGFGFDVEALVIARRRGFAIAEVPIPWTYDGDSRVRIFQDSIGMVLDLLLVFFRARSGRYDR